MLRHWFAGPIRDWLQSRMPPTTVVESCRETMRSGHRVVQLDGTRKRALKFYPVPNAAVETDPRRGGTMVRVPNKKTRCALKSE